MKHIRIFAFEFNVNNDLKNYSIFIAVQHERKPLLDKKEAAATGNSGSADANNPFGSTINSGSAVKPFAGNNLSSMFPVGLSFAELTSTLAQRGSKFRIFSSQAIVFDFHFCSPVLSNSYQERFNASLAGLTGSTGNLSGNFDTDDNSMDNITSVPAQPPNLNTNNSQSNDANLLQIAIEKNMLAEAQDIISSLQFDGQNNNDFDDVIKEDPDAMVTASQADDFDDYEDEMMSMGDRFLMTDLVTFNLQPPTIVPNYLNFHYICECGSRILFLSMFWMKKFQPFRLLRFVRSKCEFKHIYN